jgi:hypothetical protein
MDSKMDGKNLSPDQQEQLLFVMLVQQHQQIAMMGMGKIKNPATDEIDRDLKSAKFAIDTLNMLQKYTDGNLPKELSDYVNQTLTNLRLNYADEKRKGDDKEENEKSD